MASRPPGQQTGAPDDFANIDLLGHDQPYLPAEDVVDQWLSLHAQ
jgi:hypothetical protein